jgi:threonine/homoserine/homoserine lactone efflux protein
MNPLHDPAQVTAFLTFAAVAAGTPGPGNTLLTAVGARAGIRNGLPSLLGQVTGMSALLFAVTLGLGRPLLAHPLALQVMKWGGVAMLCWMAWRIASARPAPVARPASAASGPADAAQPAGTTTPPAAEAIRAPAGFFGMAAFQWINPKGWLVGVSAVAAFLDRHAGSALSQAALFAVLFILAAIPVCFPWLAFGAALQRFLRTSRAARVLNIVMAALLAASTVPLVLFA